MRQKQKLLTVPELSSYIDNKIAPGTIKNQIHEGRCPFPYLKLGGRIFFNQGQVDKVLRGEK